MTATITSPAGIPSGQGLPYALWRKVAVAAAAVLIGMERLWPHSPAPLVVVGGSIAASWFFGLHALGSRPLD